MEVEIKREVKKIYGGWHCCKTQHRGNSILNISIDIESSRSFDLVDTGEKQKIYRDIVKQVKMEEESKKSELRLKWQRDKNELTEYNPLMNCTNIYVGISKSSPAWLKSIILYYNILNSSSLYIVSRLQLCIVVCLKLFVKIY